MREGANFRPARNAVPEPIPSDAALEVFVDALKNAGAEKETDCGRIAALALPPRNPPLRANSVAPAIFIIGLRIAVILLVQKQEFQRLSEISMVPEVNVVDPCASRFFRHRSFARSQKERPGGTLVWCPKYRKRVLTGQVAMPVSLFMSKARTIRNL